jgi:hypothetical protein
VAQGESLSSSPSTSKKKRKEKKRKNGENTFLAQMTIVLKK